MPETPFDRDVLAVRDLAARIRHLLETRIGKLWVEGECSNLRQPASGHLYFTLKDGEAQIQCAWFAGRRGAEVPALRDGMKVRVFGLVTAYERGGQTQILVERAEDAGKGDLHKAFEALKAKLAAEGLFSPDRKKPLPLLPARIGIVTSPTGAAIRDILHVLERRFPDRHILLAPVKAQGAGSAEGIARAIAFFNERDLVDVMIIGRGGGSLEDLWSFNEEIVARAIAASRIPVISAVGHETDFTISDFVADLRAPTPSAAAELVIGRKRDFEERIAGLRRRGAHALDRRRLELRSRLLRAKGNRIFQEPRYLVRGYRLELQRTDGRMRQALRERARAPLRQLGSVQLRMRHALERRWRDAQRHADELEGRLMRLPQPALRERRARLEQSRRQLAALNPYAVLRRGFSITRDATGRVVGDPASIRPGDTLETLTLYGTLHSTVDRVEKTERHDEKKRTDRG